MKRIRAVVHPGLIIAVVATPIPPRSVSGDGDQQQHSGRNPRRPFAQLRDSRGCNSDQDCAYKESKGKAVANQRAQSGKDGQEELLSIVRGDHVREVNALLYRVRCAPRRKGIVAYRVTCWHATAQPSPAMRLLPFLLAAEVLTLTAVAQDAASTPPAAAQQTPASPRPAARPSTSSPEIHPDRRVTFRLTAPGATEVAVAGQSIGKAALTKDDKGAWSVTVGPVEPGVWEYSLYVNGVQVIDPGNPDIKPQRSPRTSILHVRSEPPQPWDYQDLPHGTVHRHQFSSKSLDRMREFLVYTPPGYEVDSATRYPVLYLIHGFSDNQDSWSGHGKAHWILDSLIAQGKIAPMIVVMPDGHPVPPGGGPREDYWKSNSEAFEHELVKDIVPQVDRHYRTKAEPLNRAIAGLSMGGGHSMHTGIRHLDQFGWIGAFSAAVPEKDQVGEQFAKPEDLNQKLKLLWIACGKKDFLLERNRGFVGLLKEKGIQHQWLETEGDHSWPIWRGYLTEFTPLLFKDTAKN